MGDRCRYCNGTGRVALLRGTAPCECEAGDGSASPSGMPLRYQGAASDAVWFRSLPPEYGNGFNEEYTLRSGGLSTLSEVMADLKMPPLNSRHPRRPDARLVDVDVRRDPFGLILRYRV